MWIAIIVIASLLLAATSVAPKKEVEDARWNGLGDNAFPVSKYGDAVPWLFGTCEQKSPIVMWYGHFQPIANTEEVRTGIFSSETRVVNYRYLLGFDLGICLGPGIVLEQIKVEGGKVCWDGRNGGEVGGAGVNYSNISIQAFENISGSMEFFPGNYRDVQTKSPYMSAGPNGGPHWQSGAGVINLPSYAGICHIVFVQFYIGDDNAVPPRFSFVVKNLSRNLHATYSVMSNNLDLNPMEIVYTVLTQQWAGLGIDPALIDTDNFIDAAYKLHTDGFGMSMIVSQEQSAKKIIEECMRVADGLLYQDPTSGKFKVKLIRNDYDVGTLPVLDESNIIGELQGFGRTTWENTYNQVKVKYQSRESNYQSQIVVAQDHGNIKYNDGKIKSTTINFPGVKEDHVARVLGARELELLSSPLLKCTIKCNRIAKDWRPGDLFILNWAPYGMTNAVMRIVKIDFGTLTDNAITIDCVQDKYAKDLVSFEFPEETFHIPVDVNAQEVTDFHIWVPPVYFYRRTDTLTEEDLAIFEKTREGFYMVLAKRPTEASIGFNFYVKTSEDDKYKIAAKNQKFTGRGMTYLSGFLVPSDTRILENGDVQIYNLTKDVVEEMTNNQTWADAKDGSSIVRINNTLFAYVGVTVTADDKVTLHNLYQLNMDSGIQLDFRNVFPGSTVDFVKKQRAVSVVTFPYLGSTTYKQKICSVTPVGQYDIDLATEHSYSLPVNQVAPYRPRGIRINGQRLANPVYSRSNMNFTWEPSSRLDPQLYHYLEPHNPDFRETYHSGGGLGYFLKYQRVSTGQFYNLGETTSLNKTYTIPYTGDMVIYLYAYAQSNEYGLSPKEGTTWEFRSYSPPDTYAVTLY